MIPMFLKKFIHDSIIELRQSRDGFFLLVFNGRYLLDDTIKIIIRILQRELDTRKFKRQSKSKENKADNENP